MKILLIEDDPVAAANFRAGLAPEGHVVQVAEDGRAGLLAAASADFDVLVIDRLLPGLDGLAVLQMLRGAGIQTPALFLTALGSLDDRLAGLRAGGDDYMVKPYAISELAARLIALSRRARTPTRPARLRLADLELDRTTRTFWRAGQKIELKPREYEVLEYLFRHRGDGRNKNNVAGRCLGLPLHPAGQPGRGANQPPARQDRSGFFTAAHPYLSRRGV